MNRRYFRWIVLLASLSILLTALYMGKGNSQTPTTKEITPRVFSPFKTAIAALGIVEASSGNVFIGSPLNRVVNQIDVEVGQKVKAGQVLFSLECRDLESDLLSRRLAYENSLANLQKLEALPRQEDVAAAESTVESAQITLAEAESQFNRVNGLQLNGALSQEEVARRQFAAEQAQAKLKQAQSDLGKIKAGTWAPDLKIARLKAQEDKAFMQRIEREIERTVIRSPIDATVLQIKIHEGEYPPSDPSRNPPMIIGNTDTLHLRVNINQFDASYFDPKAAALAYLQGNANIEFPLKFVNMEPYFVTKQNLTNDLTEKVDTRVLQAIYSFKEGEERIFVGQQMDVFIKADFLPKE